MGRYFPLIAVLLLLGVLAPGLLLGGLEHQVAKRESQTAAHAPEPARSGYVRLPRASDGHFWAEAKVNRRKIRFVVDTGATLVALAPEDAKRLGLRDLEFTSSVGTANGRTKAAYVTLKRIDIAGVSVKNVPAVVLGEGLTQSLLGMSFLGELQSFEAKRDALVLRN